MAILRQILGVLSLALGLALLGECAAHTMRSLLAQGIDRDLSLFLLKGAFFAPARHGAAFQILLALGTVLTVLGVALTRTWSLPFFLLGGVCLAVFGALAVERVVVPKGAEAAVLQDGVASLGAVFAQGRIADLVLLLGLGIFGILTGLFLSHWAGAKPATAPARPSARSPRPAPRVEALPEEPAPEALAETPLDGPELPPDAGASAETVHDPDLGPEAHDLDTSEVQAPDLPPAPEPAPEPEAPAEDLPDDAEEAPAEPPPPPSGGGALSAGSLVLGLLSLGGPAALFLAPLPEGTAPLAWEGGAALALGGLGLGCLAHPRRLPGKIGLGISAAGLLAAGAVLGLGL